MSYNHICVAGIYGSHLIGFIYSFKNNLYIKFDFVEVQ